MARSRWTWLVRAPLGSSTAARPFSRRWRSAYCSHAKFAFERGGGPYGQRAALSSFALFAPLQPVWLNGGFSSTASKAQPCQPSCTSAAPAGARCTGAPASASSSAARPCASSLRGCAYSAPPPARRPAASSAPQAQCGSYTLAPAGTASAAISAATSAGVRKSSRVSRPAQKERKSSSTAAASSPGRIR